jgi:hypothetical protein
MRKHFGLSTQIFEFGLLESPAYNYDQGSLDYLFLGVELIKRWLALQLF